MLFIDTLNWSNFNLRLPDAYLVLSYLIATVPINWKYAKIFPALFFLFSELTTKAKQTQRNYINGNQFKKLFTSTKRQRFGKKKQKRSCSYIAVYVSMIPGITRSSCFSRERASHMQSSFQDEMSFHVVWGVISICFHPLLLKIRNENELLYMVYLLHISWHSLVADDGFYSNDSIKILIGS